MWLLTTPPCRKQVATLPCNLSLIASFPILMFYKAVWQHTQSVVGFLLTVLLQICYRISQRKNFENRLRLDRDMSMVSPYI